MVITRKANHQGSVAMLPWPVANSRLPVSHAPAATSSSQVWAARWRRTITMLTAVKMTAAATPSHAPGPG